MGAFFEDGVVRRTIALGNVKGIYYTIDDKDSSYIGLNYIETDTMKMYMSQERQLERIWTTRHKSVMYPMTQIPPEKYKLAEFAWFEDLRPKNKEDIFLWRGKQEGEKLKEIERRQAPVQQLNRRENGVLPVSSADSVEGRTDKTEETVVPAKEKED